MRFFATFWAWLNGQLATYIGDNTARLAGVLEPAVVTLATIYVMAWGYLHLTGKVDEPLIAGLKRIAILAVIFGVGLRLWLYNTVIVDTFYRAPAQLAAAVIGSSDPVATIDAIWERGGSVAGILWSKAVASPMSNFGYFIASVIIWILIAALCVYAMFLIALSSIALAVLLALGPLFIASLFFDGTRRLFSAWMAQLANYGLITILTVMIASLLLRIVQSYATQTAARGTGLMTMDTLDMILVAVLVFLVLRQVMPIAAGLAGGLALNSFGTLSRTVMMAMPRRKAERVRGEVSSIVRRTPRWMGHTATGSAGDDAPKPGGAARDGASTGLESRNQRWQTFRP
jgi:type IV secretion system protein VirB6